MPAAAWRGRRIGGRGTKACRCGGSCRRGDQILVHVPNDGPDRKAGRLLPTGGWTRL